MFRRKSWHYCALIQSVIFIGGGLYLLFDSMVVVATYDRRVGRIEEIRQLPGHPPEYVAVAAIEVGGTRLDVVSDSSFEIPDEKAGDAIVVYIDGQDPSQSRSGRFGEMWMPGIAFVSLGCLSLAILLAILSRGKQNVSGPFV
jgi:hypothetical protein